MIKEMLPDESSDEVIEYVRKFLNELDYNPFFAEDVVLTHRGLAYIEYQELLRNNGRIH